MDTETLVTACAVLLAVLVKGGLFVYFLFKGAKKGGDLKKEQAPFEVVQRGPEGWADDQRKLVVVTGGCGFLGR
jgi:hypothetical protein